MVWPFFVRFALFPFFDSLTIAISFLGVHISRWFSQSLLASIGIRFISISSAAENGIVERGEDFAVYGSIVAEQNSNGNATII